LNTWHVPIADTTHQTNTYATIKINKMNKQRTKIQPVKTILITETPVKENTCLSFVIYNATVKVNEIRDTLLDGTCQLKLHNCPKEYTVKFSMEVNEHLNSISKTPPLPNLTMQNAYLRKTIRTTQEKARWTNYTSQKKTYGYRRHSTHI